ncbi:colanic acid biosynthesis glycosyltransferase WcaL [Rhodovulum iodosum]|nr:glycosyltransferase family 4 protein [Rhodovulum robiginosum]RSK38882.1 colanic acid biosynthesis glycosyltransferase WcaL [Rhodovulum robiginosum]
MHKTAPVAYLTGEYPKVSHTFIQREIAALRATGQEVITCTIRRAPERDVVGEDQKAEQRATWCVLEAAKNPLRLLWAHLSALLRAPRRWFSALRLAWTSCPPGGRAALWQVFYFLEAAVLAQYLRRKGAAHLHNHFANSSCSVAMLASEMSGIPFSFTLHGPAIFFEPMYWRIDEKIARAAFVSCISHFCRSQAMFFSDRAHWDRLRIVHCGVDPARYGQRPRAGFGQRVLFIGRLDAVKGVPLLLEAFARLRPAHPGATLCIIGDGPHRAALEQQARALGLDPASVFLGYRPQAEVAALLEEADMLVLPSFAEGVPVVLMEAMASRIPVIASQVAGVGELVEDGRSGFIIPPGDVDSLAERLDRLLSDPELCRRMGAAGRGQVEAAFDIDREAAWLARLFAGQQAGALPAGLRPEAQGGTESAA